MVFRHFSVCVCVCVCFTAVPNAQVTKMSIKTRSRGCRALAPSHTYKAMVLDEVGWEGVIANDAPSHTNKAMVLDGKESLTNDSVAAESNE